MPNKYQILQGDGRTVTEQLTKFAREGYVPILYSTVVQGAIPQVGPTPPHPGIIHHCMVIELKESGTAK
jgi:hypothetical protein